MRALLVILAFCTTATCSAQDTIRSRAVVDLSLDSNEKIADSRGKHHDQAVVKGKPPLINSPFWNQKGKALILEAGAKQYVEVPDSPDTDRPRGVTVSTFFLSLHPLTEGGAFHGLFAKRGNNADARTNYGINYLPASDAFQVYIHDGTGFKVAGYSVKGTIGFSKLVHLTTTFEVADAPGADKDTDVDDIRIRVFINGRIIKPSRSSSGFVDGNDAWLTNIDLKKIINDVPLTIGTSFADQEPTSGVYDEFLLFDHALSAEDVKKLFVELTGATAEQIAKQEQQQKQQVTAKPIITAVTPRGLRTGATTRLTVMGSRLNDATVFIGEEFPGVKVIETAANKLVADVTVPPDSTPGFYPLRASTEVGISKPVVMTVDRLPELAWATTSAAAPASLPAAFSGTIGGAQEVRIWFSGTKDQRVVADVESRRLGGAMDPVLEIKNNRGTPLEIEWRKHELHGDTRAEIVLPTDGSYFVELHDLAYRAPGNTPFRVRVGDLQVIDRFIPTTAGPQTALTAIGTGVPTGIKVTAASDANLADVVIKGVPEIDGPLPAVFATDAMELVESANGKQPEIDATFTGEKSQTIMAVNGTISKPNETDSFDLKVTENSKLHFQLQSRSLGSPLDGVLRVFNGKQQLGAKDTNGTGNDIAMDISVPKGATKLTVRVKDFSRGGGATHAYRLSVGRSDRVDFRIAAQTETVEIPENGSALLRLSVVRQGGGFAYAGPIGLSVEGDTRLQITPSELPEEAGNRDVFVILSRAGEAEDRIAPITIVAQSTRGPAIRRAVQVPTTVPGVVARYKSLVAAGNAKAVDATINLAGVPPVLFRGARAKLPVHVTALTDRNVGVVRFKLLTTERVRDKKSLVRLLPNQFISAHQSTIDLTVDIPFDQVDPFIDGVIVGDMVDNPFSPVPKATIYSAPIRLMVRNGVRIAPTAASLSVRAGQQSALTGRVVRRFGFAEPIRLLITGLPKGYAATAVTVPADQPTFSIPVTPPKTAKPGELKNVQLAVQSERGTPIAANQPLAMKVVE